MTHIPYRGVAPLANDLLGSNIESGMLDRPTAARLLRGWRQPDAPFQWALHVTGPVVARSPHFRFAKPLRGLEVIANAGTAIGYHDGDGLGEAVVTPYDDCVLVMPSARQARAGVTVVRFATRKAL